jgi:hypothetical protein
VRRPTWWHRLAKRLDIDFGGTIAAPCPAFSPAFRFAVWPDARNDITQRVAIELSFHLPEPSREFIASGDAKRPDRQKGLAKPRAGRVGGHPHPLREAGSRSVRGISSRHRGLQVGTVEIWETVLKAVLVTFIVDAGSILHDLGPTSLTAVLHHGPANVALSRRAGG